jgi:hypothetical protein
VLTISQKKILNSAKTAGTELGVGLTPAQCNYLMFLIAQDLNLSSSLGEIFEQPLPDFYTREALTFTGITGLDDSELFEKLLSIEPEIDTYFECLSSLHKRRMKYAKILQYQPIPTISQVGPRGLLEYGGLSDTALVTLLFWRKWFFDIDNRSGQETGYIFEPIVARCIGGQSASASKSPVRRTGDNTKGRQVDCILNKDAYEIKLRITIAASGQGRWGEEKTFPVDCQSSGYRPFLLVFDDTQANKLDELTAIFLKYGGDVKTGQAAWDHLESLAGPVISVFLDKYVKEPLNNLLESAPDREKLSSLSLHQTNESIQIVIDNESLTIERPIKEKDIITEL